MHYGKLMKKLNRQASLNERSDDLAKAMIPGKEFLGRNFLCTISIAAIDLTDGWLLSKVGGDYLEVCNISRVLVV